MIMCETKRLIIREYTLDDLDDLYEIHSNKKTGAFLEPLSLNYSEEKDKLEAYIKNVYGFYGFGYWAVCRREDGFFLGYAGLTMTDIDEDWYAELGYAFKEKAQGYGYATESILSILDFAKEELELRHVAARVDKDNHSSIKLLERLGFAKKRETIYKEKVMEVFVKELL